MFKGLSALLVSVNVVSSFELLSQFPPNSVLQGLKLGKGNHFSIDLIQFFWNGESILQAIFPCLSIKLLRNHELEIEDTTFLFILNLSTSDILEELDQKGTKIIVIAKSPFLLLKVILDYWQLELLKNSACLSMGNASVLALLFNNCIK